MLACKYHLIMLFFLLPSVLSKTFEAADNQSMVLKAGDNQDSDFSELDAKITELDDAEDKVAAQEEEEEEEEEKEEEEEDEEEKEEEEKEEDEELATKHLTSKNQEHDEDISTDFAKMPNKDFHDMLDHYITKSLREQAFNAVMEHDRGMKGKPEHEPMMKTYLEIFGTNGLPNSHPDYKTNKTIKMILKEQDLVHEVADESEEDHVPKVQTDQSKKSKTNQVVKKQLNFDSLRQAEVDALGNVRSSTRSGAVRSE